MIRRPLPTWITSVRPGGPLSGPKAMACESQFPGYRRETAFVVVTIGASRASVLVEPYIAYREPKGIAMQSSSAWKRPVLAATGLLVAAGVLVVCKATPGCYRGAQTHEEVPMSTSILGEENMSVTHAKSQVQHANDANFRNMVLKSEVPVLVDFYADWCGPCQRLAPLLEELAAENPDARIVKVNVDHSPALAAEYGVDSIPSLKVFKKGEVTDQVVGLASKKQLRALLVR